MRNKTSVNKYYKFKFNVKERVKFYKKLKSYSEAQFNIYDALVKLKARKDVQKSGIGGLLGRKNFMSHILGNMIERINAGQSIDESMRGWLPDAELSLISAGLRGRGIEYGLAEAIKFSSSSGKIKSAIISGAAYPVVLILVMIGFLAMFAIQIAPTYVAILPLESWPEMGRSFYYISNFVVNSWYVVAGVLVALYILVQATIGRWTGSTREFFDKFPPWSIYKAYQSSSFLINLSSLMRSAVPINQALQEIKMYSSVWVQYYINLMDKNFKKGSKNYGKNLDVGLFDDEVAGDIIDYSELGSFEIAVYEIGEQSLNESVEMIEKRMIVVRSIMLVLAGATITVMYLTIMDLSAATAEAASAQSY